MMMMITITCEDYALSDETSEVFHQHKLLFVEELSNDVADSHKVSALHNAARVVADGHINFIYNEDHFS